VEEGVGREVGVNFAIFGGVNLIAPPESGGRNFNGLVPDPAKGVNFFITIPGFMFAPNFHERYEAAAAIGSPAL
jgi:hypothetical protein